MKKMVMALVAVAAAAVAQAASIDWSVGMNWTNKDGTRAAAGYTTYLIDNAALETVIAGIQADGSIKDGTVGILDSQTSGTRGKVSEVTATSSALEAGKSYNFAVLIIDKVSADGPYYSVSSVFNQQAYTLGVDEAMSVSFTSSMVGAGTRWTATAVPEPTSGLLLLLGMAGLALKRKRA